MWKILCNFFCIIYRYRDFLRWDILFCLTLYTVSQKTGPLQLIWHNFTNSQHSLIILAQRYLIQFSIDYDKKMFLNWLRTSCVVSTTTVAIWHTKYSIVRSTIWTYLNSGFLGWLRTTYRGDKRNDKRLWGCVTLTFPWTFWRRPDQKSVAAPLTRRSP